MFRGEGVGEEIVEVEEVLEGGSEPVLVEGMDADKLWVDAVEMEVEGIVWGEVWVGAERACKGFWGELTVNCGGDCGSWEVVVPDGGAVGLVNVEIVCVGGSTLVEEGVETAF